VPVPTAALPAHPAADPLAQRVGVTEVPGVLPDHVRQHPAQ
jgi:hypothetical protein